MKITHTFTAEAGSREELIGKTVTATCGVDVVVGKPKDYPVCRECWEIDKKSLEVFHDRVMSLVSIIESVIHTPPQAIPALWDHVSQFTNGWHEPEEEEN